MGQNASALEQFVHHIAADQTNYHQDPWTSTHNPMGWPFEVLELLLDDYADLAEPGAVVSVEVDSGDIAPTSTAPMAGRGGALAATE